MIGPMRVSCIRKSTYLDIYTHKHTYTQAGILGTYVVPGINYASDQGHKHAK